MVDSFKLYPWLTLFWNSAYCKWTFLFGNEIIYVILKPILLYIWPVTRCGSGKLVPANGNWDFTQTSQPDLICSFLICFNFVSKSFHCIYFKGFGLLAIFYVIVLLSFPLSVIHNPLVIWCWQQLFLKHFFNER